MNFKKRVNGSWTDTPHYIHNTSTDTITTPADIYANDTAATVGLKGQMEQQSGTPTPTDPIQPQECGDRTSNLFDYTRTDGIIANTFINRDGQSVSNGEYYMSYPIYVTEGETYTWTFHNNIGTNHNNPSVAFYDATGTIIGAAQHSNNVYFFDFTVPIGCKYIRCPVFTRNNVQSTARLNLGSVSLSYENFGYKIPISSAGTTTPIYLGEVQTTRMIKKLVLDGTENWDVTGGNAPFIISIDDILQTKDRNVTFFISSHFLAVTNNASWSSYNACMSINFSGGSSVKALLFRYTAVSSLNEFKAFLAAQYAAGTPVTVWYVLAEPTTGIVNEPIRKIGDYADTVSGITIPTTAGANTLSVDTTLQPSEVTVNYKGWHPVQSAHEAENGQWD